MFCRKLRQVKKSSRELAPRLLENQFNKIALAFLQIFVSLGGVGYFCNLSEDLNNFPTVDLDCVYHGELSLERASESFANAL